LNEPIRQRLAVESEPAARAAQADAAELDGVLVDPVALDSQEARDVSRVYESRHRRADLSFVDQLCNPVGNLLDVIGV
jgi:hypothetical protein